MYHPMKNMNNQEKNTYVRQHILSALLELMNTQDFDTISIQELTDNAGVGRASFYRNFKSKQDVLAQHLSDLLVEWGKDFEVKGDKDYFNESLFRHFYKHKNVYLLLYQQGLSNLIYDSIRQAFKFDESANNIERYVKSTFAGLIFGMVDEWMRQGMQESPEELLFLIAQATPKPQ